MLRESQTEGIQRLALFTQAETLDRQRVTTVAMPGDAAPAASRLR
jgi:hypothetical protein